MLKSIDINQCSKKLTNYQTRKWIILKKLFVLWILFALSSWFPDQKKKKGFMSILLYGCTIWMLTKPMEKKLDGNYAIMLRAILNKSWRQHPTKQQLYGHQLPITKTIKIKRTRHARHCWRSRDELISDVLLWTPSNGRTKAGRPARTYIQQRCADTIGRGGERGY